MGTRSLTRVQNEDGKEIMCLYRQFDGYYEGHGVELAAFLAGIRMVNGLGQENHGLANGSGCLAAQIVAHFKTEPGGFYIDAPGTKDVWEEYEYIVLTDKPPGWGMEEDSPEWKIRLIARSVYSTLEFRGTPEIFLEWVKVMT